jgi:hypothetical protein
VIEEYGWSFNEGVALALPDFLERKLKRPIVVVVKQPSAGIREQLGA